MEAGVESLDTFPFRGLSGLQALTNRCRDDLCRQEEPAHDEVHPQLLGKGSSECIARSRSFGGWDWRTSPGSVPSDGGMQHGTSAPPVRTLLKFRSMCAPMTRAWSLSSAGSVSDYTLLPTMQGGLAGSCDPARDERVTTDRYSGGRLCSERMAEEPEEEAAAVQELQCPGLVRAQPEQLDLHSEEDVRDDAFDDLLLNDENINDPVLLVPDTPAGDSMDESLFPVELHFILLPESCLSRLSHSSINNVPGADGWNVVNNEGTLGGCLGQEESQSSHETSLDLQGSTTLPALSASEHVLPFSAQATNHFPSSQPVRPNRQPTTRSNPWAPLAGPMLPVGPVARDLVQLHRTPSALSPRGIIVHSQLMSV